MWLVLLLFILIIVLYLVKRQYSYWSSINIPGPTPIPFVGNYGMSFIGKKNAGEIMSEIYRKYEGYPVVGIYRPTTPALLIRDIDFIKNIFVKDFKHFYNNDIDIDKEVDPLFGRHPFVLKGAEWKHKRAELTSCFTSAKIKGMYVYLEKNANRMVRYVKDEIKMSNCLKAREVCIRFTLDNVATCAFGLEGKCFDESYSEFRELADAFLSPDSVGKIKFLLFSVFPSIGSYLKMRIVPEAPQKRLFDIVVSTLKYRKDNKIVRNDFLDAMSQISSQDGVFTDIDIVANAASFFGDGYETSSRVMSFALFELAQNPEVQEKLRKEINEGLNKNENQFSHEMINNLTYLDACFNESMRKNVIVYQLNKVCTEDYTYRSSNPDYKPLKVDIKAGTSIVIPIDALQMDPKYFENPDQFNPERFLSKQNKPPVYFPFGEGPRVCLGQRFGVMQIKVGIAHIIKNFQLSVNSKTQLPLKFNPFYILRDPIGDLWLDFKEIN